MEKCDRARQATDDIIRRMRFSCRIPKQESRHSHNIFQQLLLHNSLIPSDLAKCFMARLTKTEKMHGDLTHTQNALLLPLQ